MLRFFMNLSIALALGVVSSIASFASTTYVCPKPSSITCVAYQNQIGNWLGSNEETTGNVFAPNSECLNVQTLSQGVQRLVCCYRNCGLFYQDVNANSCSKLTAARFTCD